MRQFDQWTLDAIRAEGASMSWFEEQRYEWIPQIVSAMDQIMQGHTIVVVTDHERRWFSHYITETINKKTQRTSYDSYRLIRCSVSSFAYNA